MSKKIKKATPKKGTMFISVLADDETWTDAIDGAGCHVAIVKKPPDDEYTNADDMEYIHCWMIKWRLDKHGDPEPYFEPRF